MNTDRPPITFPADADALAEGCYFDRAAGERVCAFIERFCRHSKGRWAGKPFILLRWQRDLIVTLYGWLRPDGTRRFRSAYVEVPKKNGKSALVAALVVYHLVADNEQGPEVYIAAVDRKQASIIYEEARRMVEASPDLKSRLKPIPSAKRITYPKANGVALAVSADAPSQDGVSSSFTIFDELHRQRNHSLWEVFEFAGAARAQPLRVSITTAGEARRGVCWEQHEYSRAILSGQLRDIGHFAVIYAADEGDDPGAVETWAKANPSLGETLRVEDLREAFEACEGSPRKLAVFKRFRLNLWTMAESRFFDMDRWDACAGDPFDLEELRGAVCYGGLDLASTTDLAALAFLMYSEDLSRFRCFLRFYLPEDNIEALEKRDQVPYGQWVREGWIVATDGNVIDYDRIRADVSDLVDGYSIDLRRMNADPYNATQLGGQLIADGIRLEFLRQGFLSLNEPTKELERWVLSGRINHGGNPVLDWNAENAVAETDAAGNIKLSKSKSTKKIDGLAALVDACAAHLDPDNDDGASCYDSRGMDYL